MNAEARTLPFTNAGSICRCWRVAMKLDARELGMTAREAPECEDTGDPPMCGWDAVFAALRQKLVERMCEHVDGGGVWSELRLPGIPTRELLAAYREVCGE